MDDLGWPHEKNILENPRGLLENLCLPPEHVEEPWARWYISSHSYVIVHVAPDKIVTWQFSAIFTDKPSKDKVAASLNAFWSAFDFNWT